MLDIRYWILVIGCKMQDIRRETSNVIVGAWRAMPNVM